MRKSFLVSIALLLGFCVHAQNFNIKMKYATDAEECKVVNATFTYDAEERNFFIDSEEADTESRYKVLVYKKRKTEDLLFLEGGGLVVIKKTEGGDFYKVTYEFNFIVTEYTNEKQETLKTDSLILKKT